jgi:hypothetical protein
MRQKLYILVFIVTFFGPGCTETWQVPIPINLPFGNPGLVGKKPPFFQLTTIKGAKVSREDYEGKYLVH